MFHVADVRATVAWYVSIGFVLREHFSLDAEDAWASLQFEGSRIMITGGGSASPTPNRRDVDLYIYTDRVDALYEELRERVDVVEPPHDTFYGMYEWTLRDPNGYWLIFGASLTGSQTSTPCE